MASWLARLFGKRTQTCCVVLRNHLDMAGKRGPSVVLSEDNGYLSFRLQSRGVDHDDVAKLTAKPQPDRDLLINIFTTVTIQYCPWCGSKLANLFLRAPHHYRELARQHARFESP
jgi:hypothetical protein